MGSLIDSDVVSNNCFRLLALGFPSEIRQVYLDSVPLEGPLPNLVVARILVDTAIHHNVNPFRVCFPLVRNVYDNIFHVDVTVKVCLFNVLRVLLLKPDGLCGMDPQRMIEQSASVNAANIATNEVSRLFRSNLESMISVRTKLNRSQQSIVEEAVGPYVRFLNENVVSHDHPVLCAFREIARTIYARIAQPKTTKLKTICLGVSDREVREYWDNENVCFNVHGSEGKDTTRFVIEVMNNILKTKCKRNGGKDKDKVRVKIKKIEDLINVAQSTGAVPDRFDQNYDNIYHQVFLEDVGYNFEDKDWINMFTKTNATVCYGYMCIPWELVFDEVISNNVYKYHEFKDGNTKYSSMTFSYSNGYVHKKDAWSTLVNKNVIKGKRFSLLPEIISRVGPMTVFCVRRVLGFNNETVVRNLALPDYMQAVKVLDLMSCVNKEGKISKKLVYNLVKKTEFEDLCNYVMSLNDASMKLQNLVTYVRRRTCGVSLVNAELVKPWVLPSEKIFSVCITVLLYVQQQLSLTSKVFTNLDIGSKAERWKSSIRVWFGSHFGIVSRFIDWLSSGHLDDCLIVGVEVNKLQIKKLNQNTPTMINYLLERDCVTVVEEEEEDVCKCDMCEILKPCIGEQVLNCVVGKDTFEFSLSAAELSKFGEELSATDNDPIGLKTIKEKAKTSLPRTSFTTEPVKVVYIRGGPGSGKSRLIRAMATDEDLVVAPFSKLKGDYSGLNFMTQHKAMAAVGFKRIFVDEFTALSYEFLACIVYNCAAEIVYLVGDLGQTGILEGVEGISICSKIPFDIMARHELVKNFRNPRDTVALLNKFYDYNMERVSGSFGYRFRHLDMWSLGQNLTPLCFTRNAAASLGLQNDRVIEKMTVRSNQGTTHDDVGLFVTSHDANLANIDCLNVVALSRHRHRCILFYDNGEGSASIVHRAKSFWDSFVDSLILPPTKNVCLLEALSKLLTRFSRTGFTVDDLWRNLVCVIGLDEARSIRNSMLTDKHLELLMLDLGFSVTLIVKGKKPSNCGFGASIGQIGFENGHFFAKATVDRLSSSCVSNFPLANLYEDVVDNVDVIVHDGDSANVICGCRDQLILTKMMFSSDIKVITGRTLNSDFAVGCYSHGSGKAWKLFDIPIYAIPYPKVVTDVINKLAINLDNSIVVNLRFLRSSVTFTSTDLGLSGKVYIIALEKGITFKVTCNGVDTEIILSVGDVLKFNKFENHKLVPLDADLNQTVLVVGHIEDVLDVCGGKTCPIDLFSSDCLTGYKDHFVWSDRLKGRQASFFSRDGGGYKYNGGSHKSLGWPLFLNDIISSCGFDWNQFNHCLAQKYVVGGSIKFHADNEECYPVNNAILTVNLVGDAKFSIMRGSEMYDLNVTSGNYFLMPKGFQSDWKHAVCSKTDGRISLTFRNTNIQGDLRLKKSIDDVPTFGSVFSDHINTFAFEEPGFPIAAKPELITSDEIVSLEQTPTDSYLLLKEHFDRFFGTPAQFTNEIASRTIYNEFSKGVFNTNLLDQINMRGHPVNSKMKFYCISTTGPGLYYFQKSQWQELQCLQGRYLGKTLSADYDVNGQKIAHEIADLFVDEHMNVENAVLDMDEVGETVLSSLRSMRTKNYESQTSLVNGGIGSNIVRFHMKDIFKPFKDSVDVFKVGQGISAWSKEAQSLFQTGCRIINLAFSRSLKSNVIYDNLVPELDMLTRANQLLSSLPSVCSNGVIDATACDSGQNAFTQAIEKRILERLGVDGLFLEWYYRYRKSYILAAKNATAKVDWIKTSGEPATLLCNTILMMALMNALLRGEGPCVLLGKGDDGLKRQANLCYNKELVGRFTKYTALQFKVDINKPVNFCGFSLVGSKLYPCIFRKAQKIVGHRFKDYTHFCEYQQSLRDWVLLCNKIGYRESVHTTATFTGLSENIIWGLLYAIQSISHINHVQFRSFFNECEVDVNEEFLPVSAYCKETLNFAFYAGL